MFKQRCFRLLLLASAIATSLSAAAYSFESAGIYYNITGNNTVEVTYSDLDHNSYSGSISVPETVTNNGTEYSVTKIGGYAFKGSAVTSVSMPEGITSIGFEAFSGCQNLESVALPESLTTLDYDAFNSCQSLKTIKIPSGVTAIPGSCFYCCSSLESVTIPEGVMTIGEYAFCGCNHKELTLPSTVTMIGRSAFVSNNRFQSITCNATTPPSLGENVFGYNAFATVKVPLSSIAAYRQAEGWKVFTNYSGGEVAADGITYRIDENGAMVAVAEATLTEANILSAVEFEGNQYPVIKINDNVFADNTNLTAVTLPEGLVEIGASAFLGCQNLESVVFPESLTTFGRDAFNDCRLLKAIKIPSGVTTIPDRCFYGCSSLESVTIPEGVTAIGDDAFQSCNLNALTLPESLEKIKGNAFEDNRSLKSVNIPAKVKTIGAVAFNNCGLTDLVIPEGVQTIGSHAFSSNSLKNLTLPSTITSIGESAFRYNYDLQSITCNAATPPTLGDDAFYGCNIQEVKVPISSIAAYKQANGWKDFTNYYGGDVVNNGITYRIDENGATITAAEATLAEANILSAVEFEGNQYPVIKINDRVFSGNTNLTTVTLPEGLTTLGSDAFNSCKSLRAVKVSSGVEAIPSNCFYECSSLESVSLPEGLVEIGVSAFYECQNLESVALPESLTTLGDYAFISCKLLKTIKIPSGVTAIPRSCFFGCSSLESVTIPEGVMTIGSFAFKSCNLKALTLPESLEKIGDCAFYDNRSLKSVNIPAKVKTIGKQAFYDCGLTELVIPEGVQTIDNYAFFNNSLQNLTLPSTITSIGESAFRYNYDLQSITCNAATPPTLGDNAFGIYIKPVIKVPLASIAAYKQANGWKDFTNYYGGEVVADGITYRIDENGAMVAVAEAALTEANIPSVVEFEGNQYPVIKINDKVFSGNTNLTSVTLPEGLVEIGNYAFSGCKNLESVTLPESLTTLGDRAFYACKLLKTIKIPSGVTAIPGSCFDGCSSLESVTIPEGVTDIGDSAFSGCNLNALTLPESLEKIGSWAFYHNRSVKSINIPAKVKTIEEWAFTYCGLTELVIPEGVTTIGQRAFFNNSLQNLTLPSTITSIGESAFYDNNRFLSIICNAATPPTLGADVFGRSITTCIKVPMASIAAYRQAEGWKNFINYYGGEMISDGITYWFNEKEAMVAVAEAALTEANIPSAVEFEGNRCQVIKINDKVFSGNTNLTTVSLPDNLVEIGAFAFNECKNLASVALPESLTTLGDRAFYACKSLKTIKIPSGITIIPDSCFYECSSLESVTIPEGVTAVGGDALRFCNFNALTLPESLEKIGSHAFDGNKSLKSVNIPAKVKTIEERAFSFCGLTELVIPEGVQTIGSDAFYKNSLENLTLPSTITSIGGGAFGDINNLESIICNAATPPTLGAGAFSININPVIKVPISSIAAYRKASGWKVFTNYYGGEMIADGITYRINEKEAMVAAVEPSLTEANIPSAVEFEGNRYLVIKINGYAFADNTNLTSVTLPDGLVEIGNYAFITCKNLESVTLPESLTTFGYNAFGSCKSLKAVKIPSGVTTIPDRCFYGCSSLESVIIPEGVTAIGICAFAICNLNALTLPESLEKIGVSAFNGNSLLKSVNIPAKVKTIDESAFSYCGLTDLVIQEGVQVIGRDAFSNNSLENLTLPSTITMIDDGVFSHNNNLRTITCNAVTPPMLGYNEFYYSATSSVKVPLQSIAAYRQADGWKNISEYYGGEEIIDGVTYRIDDKGAYVQAVDKTVSEVSLAENVAFEGAQYPLYKIADNAFAGNGSITLVTVPATVETIGSNAFDGVTYPIIKIKATTPPVLASKLPMLSAIVPPASVKAYKAANYWKDMTIIGEGKNDIEVTTSATVDLTEAIMTQAKITPASVTSIKVHGPLTNDDIINALNTNMRSCYAIDLSDAEIEALPDGAFDGKIGLLEISLPAGLKAIGNNAFRGCFALRNEVTIPAGVQTIGSYAFSGCRNAKFNPALPETLTAIGDYAFQNCANLYAVTLPASLQTIGEYAFYASSIQEIVLPEGLFSLGDGAFWFCKALETADFVNSMDIISIPSNAFNGCSGLRKVYLPFFVEEIGDYAFSGCKSLKSLNFFECEEITKIGEFAFRGCRSLKSLDLFKCENLTTIGSRAFSGCTSLKSLNLPKSLETIGEYAFSGCQAISVISSPSLVPPTIASESALNGIDKDVCVLTMPKSVYLDYFRAPYWGQFVEYTASVLVGVDGQGSVMYSNNFGTTPTPVKVAAFYATAGEGEGVEEDEGDGITAEAYDSANICAKDNSTLTFRIVPDEGNEIKSVTYAGEDVTAQVVDGLFTTPVINGDTNLDVSFVASTDYIAIPVIAVSKGAEVVVPVELVNTAEVMGIECKVQIPEGFSVAKKADGSLKVEQTERKADQTLTAAVDGNVLTVKTSGTQAYTGNTGAVFTIAIAPDEATAPADYVLKVTDVKFVNATGVASRPDAKTTLTLRDYVLGDVDSDQLVAINDAVIVMNHIVGADTPAFNAKAADMDGNGSVEINDAVLIMNTVVGTESTKSIKKTSATEPNADELTVADIEICQGGTAMLSLDLANLDALTAAQFEITLPEGITAGKALAGERASRHMIKTNMVGNVLKVAMLSAESADFEGSEGAILLLPLSADKAMTSGSYGISLRNVKMSDARGNLFILPDADSSVVVKDWSGVDSVAFDRLRVYGGNGEICIESPADTMIQIVAVDGRAFAVEASAGKTAVAVSAGVYVVNGQKVIVK